MSEGKTEASIYQQAEDGKTELSLMHFAITNPQWQPPRETTHFISQLKERVQREATGAPSDAHSLSLSESEVRDHTSASLCWQPLRWFYRCFFFSSSRGAWLPIFWWRRPLWPPFISAGMVHRAVTRWRPVMRWQPCAHFPRSAAVFPWGAALVLLTEPPATPPPWTEPWQALGTRYHSKYYGK